MSYTQIFVMTETHRSTHRLPKYFRAHAVIKSEQGRRKWGNP